MILYRDMVVYKHPNQPAAPESKHRAQIGFLGLEKLTAVFVPLCTQKEWAIKFMPGQEVYSPGPRDLMVWDQDVSFINEPNQTDKLLTAMLFFYSRKADGNNFDKFHEVLRSKRTNQL